MVAASMLWIAGGTLLAIAAALILAVAILFAMCDREAAKEEKAIHAKCQLQKTSSHQS